MRVTSADARRVSSGLSRSSRAVALIDSGRPGDAPDRRIGIVVELVVARRPAGLLNHPAVGLQVQGTQLNSPVFESDIRRLGQGRRTGKGDNILSMN